jgi:hypothetical protein
MSGDARRFDASGFRGRQAVVNVVITMHGADNDGTASALRLFAAQQQSRAFTNTIESSDQIVTGRLPFAADSGEPGR